MTRDLVFTFKTSQQLCLRLLRPIGAASLMIMMWQKMPQGISISVRVFFLPGFLCLVSNKDNNLFHASKNTKNNNYLPDHVTDGHTACSRYHSAYVQQSLTHLSVPFAFPELFKEYPSQSGETHQGD